MLVNKISSNLNNQYFLKPENVTSQADTPPCRTFETSIYNQKNVTLPFRGGLSTMNVEDRCISVLKTMRNNGRVKFNQKEVSQILDILKKESSLIERLFTLKDTFCLTDNDIELNGENKVDFYDKYGEPISNKLFKDCLNLVVGRDGDDRLALLSFAKYEIDIEATKPIGAFLKLSEDKKQELIPFLRRIAALNLQTFMTPEKDNTEHVNNLYEHFRLLVYAIDDLSKARKTSAKQKIKEDLLDFTVRDDFFAKQKYSDEATKETVLNLVNDMNEYVLQKII